MKITEEYFKKAKATFAIFISKVKKKLKQCGRNYSTFIEKEYHWLQGNVMTNKGAINNEEFLENKAKEKKTSYLTSWSSIFSFCQKCKCS